MSVVFLRAARVGVFATDIGLKLKLVELRNHTCFLFVWFTLLCPTLQDPTTVSFLVVVSVCVIVLPGSIAHPSHSVYSLCLVRSLSQWCYMTLYDSLPRHSDMSLYSVHVSSDVA